MTHRKYCWTVDLADNRHWAFDDEQDAYAAFPGGYAHRVDADLFLRGIPEPRSPRWWRWDLPEPPGREVSICIRQITLSAIHIRAGLTKIERRLTAIQIGSEWVRLRDGDTGMSAQYTTVPPYYIRIYSDYPPLHGDWKDEKL